jgi:hypothetical protein
MGCACTGYLALFVAVFGGLEQPVGDDPPSMDRPLPSSSSHDDSDVPAGAHFPAKKSGSPQSPTSSADAGRNASPSPTSPATSSARPGGTNR